MKKNIYTWSLLVLLIFILIVLMIKAIYDDSQIDFKEKEKMILSLQSDPTSTFPVNYSVKEVLMELPYEVIELLYKSKVKIEPVFIVQANDGKATAVSHFSFKDETINIQAIYSNENILLHEVGHAYSYNKNYFLRVSEYNTFKTIYKKEKDFIFPEDGVIDYEKFKLQNNYVKSSVEEYFAQCFSMYFTGDLKEDTLTYKFFHRLFD